MIVECAVLSAVEGIFAEDSESYSGDVGSVDESCLDRDAALVPQTRDKSWQ